MDKKIHPTGFSVFPVLNGRNWGSHWYAQQFRNFATTLPRSDLKVRDYLKTKLRGAVLPRLPGSWERHAQRTAHHDLLARQGVVIGKEGAR